MSLENTLNLIEEAWTMKASGTSRASKANRYIRNQLGNIRTKANPVIDSLYRKAGSVSPREAKSRAQTLQSVKQGYDALKRSSMLGGDLASQMADTKKQRETESTINNVMAARRKQAAPNSATNTALGRLNYKALVADLQEKKKGKYRHKGKQVLNDASSPYGV